MQRSDDQRNGTAQLFQRIACLLRGHVWGRDEFQGYDLERCTRCGKWRP